MKNSFIILVSIIMIALSVFLLVGCDKENTATTDSKDSSDTSNTDVTTQHKHTYEGNWVANADGHYKVSTCHPDVIELSDHRDSVDMDGKCDVCHFLMKEEDIFTVTVLDSDRNPISGVTLKIYTSTGDKILTTDENGNASRGFIYHDTVRVIIQAAPEGYESYVDEFYEFERNNLEIIFAKN